MDFKQWLEKPYPLIERIKDKLILAFGFGLFVYLFLLIYEPFGAEEVTRNKLVFLLGFGICVFFGLLISYLLLPKVFPKIFNPESWKIKKEILYLLWSLLLISVFNYAYNTIIGRGMAPYHNWLEFFGITFSIGIFPILGLIYFIEKRRNKKNYLQAKTLSKSIRQDTLRSTADKTISIQSETLKTEPLLLYLDDFVFATSDNNYTTIFYVEDNKLHRKLLRLSFKNLENQLSEFQSIIRCHRSYLVNKTKIKSIKGNARSLTLQIEKYDGTIPVSRSFPREKLI